MQAKRARTKPRRAALVRMRAFEIDNHQASPCFEDASHFSQSKTLEVSWQMLIIQLRELEQVGLLRRQVYVQVPLKVEYSLTDLGRSLGPLLCQMHTWGKWYGEQIGPEYDWLVSLGGRWKFWIWYHLLSGPKRFGEVQRLLPRASRQMLAIHLRELERMGVLQRRTSVQGSPKVEYTLSELGRQSEPMLRQMYAWGR